jgi:hypothetical protein
VYSALLSGKTDPAMATPRTARTASTRNPAHPKSLTISLGEILQPGELDRSLVRSYGRHAIEPDNVILDFGRCRYVDITELCATIAFFRSRFDRRKRTQLKLPRNRDTRVFMNVWKFVDALVDSVGQPKEQLVVSEDRKFLYEPITTYRGLSQSLHALETRWTPNESKPAERKNFFGFMTYKLGPKQMNLFLDENALIPLNEATRWQGPLIKAVLGNHLRSQSGEEDEVSRVVIYESLANAVQHPYASTIQVASRYYRPEPTGSEATSDGQQGAITICVWDDGESMVDTLGRVLRKGGKVRQTLFPTSMYERVLLKVKDESGKKLHEDVTIDQAEDPLPNASDEMLLLACLFPGVTRRVVDRVTEIRKLSTSSLDSPDLASSLGMGLYILTRTVVDRYGGELSIRSGSYFLNLKLAYDAVRVLSNVRYICSVTRYPGHFPQFKGNLLLIRIPSR